MSLDLIGVFAAGLFTFVTPCVLPLIPIYLAALVGTDIRSLDAQGRGQLMVRALFFALGFVGVFTLLGLGASSLGAFLAEHKAAVQAFGATLIALFGLKFLGVIRIPFLDRTIKAQAGGFGQRLGAVSALVMGVVFAAGWSPCVGPVLGSVLTYTASATAEPWTGAGYLALYGLGFALPLLGVAAFAEAGLRLLRKIGPHLRKVELATGALLLAVAGFMAADALPDLAAPGAPSGPTPDALAAQAPAAAGPTMLIFTSDSCPICQRMKPIIAGITEQCDGNRVRVQQVDLSQPGQRELAHTYRLVGVPTFVFLDQDRQEVARLVGEQTDATLRRALSALRGEPCPGLAILDEGGGHLHPDDVSEPTAPAPACAGAALGHEEQAPAPACEGV